MSLHPALSTKSIRTPWLEHAVFGLDRRLRRLQGVYEYTADENCLFRAQRDRAHESISLSDGTRVQQGDPLIILHLWNEQMPAFPKNGATIAWARQISRGIDLSLRHLAQHLASEPELDHVAAIRADIALGASDRLLRLSARFGFEKPNTDVEPPGGVIHRFGENILVFMLIMASNPASIRMPVLWRDRMPVYLSRAVLEWRYIAAADANRERGHPC